MTFDPNRRVQCACGCWHREWHRFPDTQEPYQSPRCAECSLGLAERARRQSREAGAHEEQRLYWLRRLAATGWKDARQAVERDERLRRTIGLPPVRGSDEDQQRRQEDAESMREVERELIRLGMLKPRGRAAR